VGLGVTIGLLAWALHGVDARALVDTVRRANPWLIVVTIALATLTFPLRAIRWRLILRGVGGSRLPLGPLWHATAIGFMANNLLPVRAGEFARAYAVRQAAGGGVRFTTALASIGVERVFDGLVLVGLLTLALVVPSFPHRATIGGTSLSALATAAAALFAGMLLVALLVVHRPGPWLALLRRVAHAVLPARHADRVTHVALGLVAGLDVLKSPARFLGVVGWSLVLWLVNAASFTVCFWAFGLSVPSEGALLLQGIIGFGVALPSSPGFVGVFEAATRATLALYGVDATRAVSYALAYHAGTFLPITLLGLASLSRMRLHLADLRTASATQD
jgi:glycosyltransferase 2 family protein